MQKYQKTISIPWRYRYGFLEILPLRLYFYEDITSIGYTMCPGYYWSTSSRADLGFNIKIRRRKIVKTISIPARYRYGFLEILPKPTPTGMICIYISQICVQLLKFFQKQLKTAKKPYLYHTGIDMVWAKMSKASLDLYPPLRAMPKCLLCYF